MMPRHGDDRRCHHGSGGRLRRGARARRVGVVSLLPRRAAPILSESGAPNRYKELPEDHPGSLWAGDGVLQAVPDGRIPDAFPVTTASSATHRRHGIGPLPTRGPVLPDLLRKPPQDDTESRRPASPATELDADVSLLDADLSIDATDWRFRTGHPLPCGSPLARPGVRVAKRTRHGSSGQPVEVRADLAGRAHRGTANATVDLPPLTASPRCCAPPVPSSARRLRAPPAARLRVGGIARLARDVKTGNPETVASTGPTQAGIVTRRGEAPIEPMQFTAPLMFGTSRVPNPFLLFLPVFDEESPS